MLLQASARRVSMQTGSTALLLAIKNLGEDSEQNSKFMKFAKLLIINHANLERMNEVKARNNCVALPFVSG